MKWLIAGKAVKQGVSSMHLLSPQTARDTLRAYPFKAGRSELKKALALFFPADEPCVITTMDGIKLHLDDYKSNSRIFWWFEEQEPALQYYVRSFVPAGARFLDVGAAHGIIGLLAARLKGAQVKFVEAYPPTIAMLTETLKLNPELAHLCELIGQPCALGPGDSRYPDKPGITLEKIIRDAGWDHVEFLKVDVDGPDFDVLSSAGPFLRPDFIEAIYIETEVAPPASIRKIAELGYVPYGTKRTLLPDLLRLGINQTERTHFRALDLSTLTEQNVPSNTLFLDKNSLANRHMSQWCG